MKKEIIIENIKKKLNNIEIDELIEIDQSLEKRKYNLNLDLLYPFERGKKELDYLKIFDKFIFNVLPQPLKNARIANLIDEIGNFYSFAMLADDNEKNGLNRKSLNLLLYLKFDFKINKALYLDIIEFFNMMINFYNDNHEDDKIDVITVEPEIRDLEDYENLIYKKSVFEIFFNTISKVIGMDEEFKNIFINDLDRILFDKADLSVDVISLNLSEYTKKLRKENFIDALKNKEEFSSYLTDKTSLNLIFKYRFVLLKFGQAFSNIFKLNDEQFYEKNKNNIFDGLKYIFYENDLKNNIIKFLEELKIYNNEESATLIRDSLYYSFYSAADENNNMLKLSKPIILFILEVIHNHIDIINLIAEVLNLYSTDFIDLLKKEFNE